MRSFIIIFVLLNSALLGQVEPFYNDADTHYFWIGLGVGGSAAMQSDFGGFTGAVIPTWQYREHVVSLRYSNTIEPLMEGPKPDRYLHETSLLYGRCKKGHFYYYALCAGPGFVQGMERGDYIADSQRYYEEYEEKPFAILGLTLNAQASLLTPYIGVGLDVCCNLNSEQSFWSFLLCLQLGHLLDFGL